MKKILFISIANLYLCPYINKYIDAIGDSAAYDIVYWNRHGVDEPDYGADRVFQFNKSMADFVPKPQKLIHMVQYCRYVKKIMKHNHYDRIIVLHSNAAVLLMRTLEKKYPGKYIFDVRDYSFEHIRPFFAIEKRLIDRAGLCFISSDGFRKFLPDHEYHLAHNNIKIAPEFIQEYRACHQGHRPVRISFIGMVRFFEQGKLLGQKLGNDPRFQVNYFGKNANLMKQQVGEYDNHFYMDQFPPEKTLELYQMTDVINNIYGNHDPYVDYLLSNKLYYTAMLGIPILVSPDTHMAEIVQRYGLGFVFDQNDPNAVEDFYAYYTGLDWQAFYQNCEAFCRVVEEDDRQFVRLLRQFIEAG